MIVGELEFYQSIIRIKNGKPAPSDIGLMDAINDYLQHKGLIPKSETFLKGLVTHKKLPKIKPRDADNTMYSDVEPNWTPDVDEFYFNNHKETHDWYSKYFKEMSDEEELA